MILVRYFGLLLTAIVLSGCDTCIKANCSSGENCCGVSPIYSEAGTTYRDKSCQTVSNCRKLATDLGSEYDPITVPTTVGECKATEEDIGLFEYESEVCGSNNSFTGTKVKFNKAKSVLKYKNKALYNSNAPICPTHCLNLENDPNSDDCFGVLLDNTLALGIYKSISELSPSSPNMKITMEEVIKQFNIDINPDYVCERDDINVKSGVVSNTGNLCYGNFGEKSDANASLVLPKFLKGNLYSNSVGASFKDKINSFELKFKDTATNQENGGELLEVSSALGTSYSLVNNVVNPYCVQVDSIASVQSKAILKSSNISSSNLMVTNKKAKAKLFDTLISDISKEIGKFEDDSTVEKQEEDTGFQFPYRYYDLDNESIKKLSIETRAKIKLIDYAFCGAQIKNNNIDHNSLYPAKNIWNYLSDNTQEISEKAAGELHKCLIFEELLSADTKFIQ